MDDPPAVEPNREPAAAAPEAAALGAEPERGASKPAPRARLRVYVTWLLVLAAFSGAVAWAVLRARPRADIEPLLQGLAKKLKAKHRAPQLAELERDCRAGECDCVSSASSLALDLDAAADALALLDAGSKRCSNSAELPGVRSEALVRAGKRAEGTRLADQTLAARPKDRHALMSLALANRSSTSGAVYAEAAEQAGRGAVALRLRGLIAYEAADLKLALALFERALKADPSDVEAHYNRALINQRLGRYYEAREGYLRVLALEPRSLDSRYNLAVLTHRAGATAEAQHHLAKLRQLKADPALLHRLEQLLATPVPRPEPAPAAQTPGEQEPPSP